MRPGARASAWLATAAATGTALALLYPDSDQQDAGYHFLFARWAWEHPKNLVSVWGRPLFTLLYSLPAAFGYLAAKLATVAVAVAAAWRTWRLAQRLGLERAELAIPLLWLQPAFFQVCSTTLTEPLFALGFVLAVELRLRGAMRRGLLAASALILIRPEGACLAPLWGIAALRDHRLGAWPARVRAAALLGIGPLAWWAAALLVTGDPLWLVHDWPPDWSPTRATYGSGPVWWYVLLLPLIAGPVLMVPFLAGLARVRGSGLAPVLAPFAVLFAVHALLYAEGRFGSAGYARYFVCVAPATALITLAGWNVAARRLPRQFGSPARPGSLAALVVSTVLCWFYVDGSGYNRDAVAVADTVRWFRAQEAPVARLVWSQAYMCILLGRDPEEKPVLTGDRGCDLALLREMPRHTLVFWDADTGPQWTGLEASDFESAGYRRLRSESYRLEGVLFRPEWRTYGGPRFQQMHLLYKE